MDWRQSGMDWRQSGCQRKGIDVIPSHSSMLPWFLHIIRVCVPEVILSTAHM